MQPFDLEKALAGEPVKLRNGEKAFLLKKLNTRNPTKYSLQLLGYILDEDNFERSFEWTINGSCRGSDLECPGDIIGMWQEPRPQVTITIPAPLLNDQKEKWYIDVFGDVLLGDEDNSDGYLSSGLLFATKEDAQTFLQTIREARR